MKKSIHFYFYLIVLNADSIFITDKLDEDTIYRWYRVLQDLFYNQDMRLYHTVANDPLCLEVTILESCIYGLSFIRSLGSKSFVLHPPAHDGN